MKKNLTLMSKMHELRLISVNDPLEVRVSNPPKGIFRFMDLESKKYKLIDLQKFSHQRQEKPIMEDLAKKLGVWHLGLSLEENYLDQVVKKLKKRGRKSFMKIVKVLYICLLSLAIRANDQQTLRDIKEFDFVYHYPALLAIVLPVILLLFFVLFKLMKKLKRTKTDTKKEMSPEQKLKGFSEINDDMIFLDQARVLLNDFSLRYSNAKVSHLTDSELVNYYNKKNIQNVEYFRDLANQISTSRYTNHKAERSKEIK